MGSRGLSYIGNCLVLTTNLYENKVFKNNSILCLKKINSAENKVSCTLLRRVQEDENLLQIEDPKIKGGSNQLKQEK